MPPEDFRQHCLDEKQILTDFLSDIRSFQDNALETEFHSGGLLPDPTNINLDSGFSSSIVL